MALSISGYNPSGYKSNVELPNPPLDLIMKVMEFKQNKFDSSFQALQGYKNTALNIQFLNKERQNEVDNLNKDLDAKFSALNGEFGDLSQSSQFNKFTAWFDGFKKNTDLIHAYNIDKKWQSEHSKVQSLKQSKDPSKAGYSAVNEYVFNHKLNSYVNTTKDKPVDFKGYTPYKDIVAETTRIYKSLPKKEWSETIPDPQRPGYMKVVKMSGYNQDDLHNVINSMGGDMQEQFQVEAEYGQLKGMSTNPQAYRENLHNSYTALYQERKGYLENKLNQAKQNGALATTQEEKDNFNQAQKQLEQSITELGLGAKSKDWFLTTDESNLLGLASQLHVERKVGGLAKGLSNKPSVEYKPDLAYFSAMRLRQTSEQFNANLRYRFLQDAVQNQFRAADLQLRAQNQANQLKYNYDKLKVDAGGVVDGINDAGSIGTTGSSGLFSDKSEFSSAEDKLLHPDETAFNALEKGIQTKSFNVADGADYKIPFMGQSQSNDQIMEKIITMYDPSNSGRSTAKIKELLNREGLATNISLNTLVDSLPLMKSEMGHLDIKNQVGFAKTRTNQILTGDKSVLNGNYKNFAASSSLYQMQKQEEIAFNQNKAEYYRQAVIDLPEKDWFKMTPDQQSIVSTRVRNNFIKDNKLPAFGARPVSYQELGDSPKKGQEALWRDQSNAARILKEKSGIDMDIPQTLISSARKLDDGTTIIQFKGEPEFKKVFGENWEKEIKHDPSGWSGDGWTSGSEYKIKGGKNVEQGEFRPNGTVVFKTDALHQTTSADRVLANGNTYHEVLNKGGQNINFSLTAHDNYYEINVDGRTIMQPRLPNQQPSEALNVIKREILK